MGCCLGCVGTIFPRVALVVMWLIGYSQPAFATVLWPILGFLFMPFTTCFYVVAMNEFGGLQGMGLALLILGVVFDIGSLGGGAHSGYEYRYGRVRRRW